MMNELIVYQTFGDKEQAIRTAATLENHGIPVSVEENLRQLDSNFIGQQFGNPYSLKIPGSSFVRANEILMEHTVINMEDVDKEYILFSLSNEELIDVLKNKDDWGVYNYKLAQQILKERSITLPKEEILKAQEDSIKRKTHASGYDVFWILVGYCCAFISMYVFYSGFGFYFFAFPTLFALVVGYRMCFSKKTLSNGERVWTYAKPVRIHGIIIFIITIIMSVLNYDKIFLHNVHF